jgi:tetratricopeptide (TPR) repeat protein
MNAGLRATCLAVLVLSGAAAGCSGSASSFAPQAGDEAIPDVDLTTLPEPIRKEALVVQDRARRSPGDAEAVGELGMRYFAYEFFQAAQSCFTRAGALQPDAFKWRYYLALTYEKIGDVGKAASAYERALAIDSSYGSVLVGLANLISEDDPNRADGLFRRAITLDPRDPAPHFGLGRTARLRDRREEALGHFEKALELYPDYAEAHYAVAMLLAAAGKRDEAQDHLRRHAEGSTPPPTGDPLRMALLQLNQNAAHLRRQATHLAESGEVTGAVQLLEKSIETDPSGSTSHIHLGVRLAQQGRFEAAAEQFRLALKAAPNSVEAKSSLGLALTELGQLEEAQRLYREVLDQHPDHGPTLVYLGELLARQGKTAEALEHLRRGVQAQPGNGLYQYTLGELLARSGASPDEAILHLRKAVQLLPQHAGAHYTLGVLLARGGERAGAKVEFEQAVKLSPQLTDACIGLAGIALEEGDSQSAVKWAERANDLSGYSRSFYLETLADAYQAAGRAEDATRIRLKAGGRP